jgi:hypothetical protein
MTDSNLARRPTNIKLHKEAMKLLPKLEPFSESEGREERNRLKDSLKEGLKDSLREECREGREGREEEGRKLVPHLKDTARLKAETIRYYSRPRP